MWYRVATLFLICERASLVLLPSVMHMSLRAHARVSWWLIVAGSLATLAAGLWELSGIMARASGTKGVITEFFSQRRAKEELKAYDAAMEEVRRRVAAARKKPPVDITPSQDEGSDWDK